MYSVWKDLTAYSEQNDSSITRLCEYVIPRTVRKPDKSLGSSTAGGATHYKLEKEAISKDLTNERPAYILSAYGPGKDAPLQLFGGHPREQSFEELRTRHYELTKQGKLQDAVQEAQALVNTAEQQMKTALHDLDGAIKYICDGENEHPNRIDTCRAKGQLPSHPQTAKTSQSTFGQTSSAPTFGQPALPTAFGQPSSTPAFGQPSVTTAFSRPSVSVFGQPSAPVSAFGPGSAPAFGKPSTPAFGQPSASASTFAQPSTPAFGQPTALSRPTTSFGQPPSVLGQPSTQTPAFGQSSSQAPGFGKPSTQSSAFSQPSTQAQTLGPSANQASTFALPSAPSAFSISPPGVMKVDDRPTNPFGAPSQTATFGPSIAPPKASAFASLLGSSGPTPFGRPNTTAAAPPSSQIQSIPSNPFGVTAPPTTGATFGQPTTVSPGPSNQKPTQQQISPFGQPTGANSTTSIPTINAGANKHPIIHLPNGNLGQKDAQGRLRTWNGKEVRYIADHPHYKESNSNEWQRIWFPDGPPIFTKTEDLPESAYDVATKEKYRFVIEHGRFGSGGIPMIPPRKEWCNWNL